MLSSVLRRRNHNNNDNNNNSRNSTEPYSDSLAEGAAPIGPHMQLNNPSSLRNMVLRAENSPNSIASDALSNVYEPELRRIPSFQYNNVNGLRYSYRSQLIKKLFIEFICLGLLISLNIYTDKL